MKLNSNQLTFAQTDRFKGLLILLIVFGHISELLQQYGSLHATLYSFHVISFLLLPFLFNKDLLNVKNILKNVRRIYIPYSIFFLLSLLVFSFLEHRFDPLSALTAWGIGSSALLKIETGLRVFWFFPALMFSVILIMYFNTLSKKIQKVWLIFMLFAHIAIPFIPKTYLFYFPLSSYISFYLFVIGIAVSFLYKHFDYSRYSWQLSTLFLLALYVAYGSDFSLASAIFPNIKDHTFNFILQDFIMILSFFVLILWSRDIRFFEYFGKYSLAIFTIHPFIIQSLNLMYDWNGLTEGIIKFLSVLIINILIIKLIYYFNINKVFYPK